MKALIAVTCIAVLAAVGYYFFKEYSASIQIAERKAVAAAAEAQAERDAMRAPCRKDLDDLRSYEVFEKPNVQWSSEFLAIRVNDCVRKGILSAEETALVKHRLPAN